MFDPPPRRYAVGAAYLRAQGTGRSIVAVHGLDRRERGDPVTGRRGPACRRPRRDADGTYEGDGYVIVRDPDTAAVEAALGEIITTDPSGVSA